MYFFVFVNDADIIFFVFADFIKTVVSLMSLLMLLLMSMLLFAFVDEGIDAVIDFSYCCF